MFNVEIIFILGMLIAETGALHWVDNLTPEIIAFWGVTQGLVSADEVLSN